MIQYSFQNSYSFTREESFDYLIIIYVEFKFSFVFCFGLIDVLSATQFAEFLHAYYYAINRCCYFVKNELLMPLFEKHHEKKLIGNQQDINDIWGGITAMLMLMVMLMLIMNQLCYQRGSSTEEQLTNMNCECVVGQNKIQVKMILT